MIEVMYDRWFVKYSKLDPERKEDLKTILIGLKNAESVIGNALSRQLNSEDLLRSLDELKVDNADQVKIAAVVNGFTPLISSAPTSAPIPPVNPALRPRTLVLPTRKTGTDKFPPVVKPNITLSDSTQEDEVVPIEMANGPVPPSKKKPATAKKETSWWSSMKSWNPFKKKDKEPVDEVGNVAINPDAPRTKKRAGGSVIIWASVILFLLIILVGAGVVFFNTSLRSPSPRVELNSGVESSDPQMTGANDDSEECTLPDGSVGIKTYYIRPLESVDGLTTEMKYVAIRSGSNYILALDANTPITMPVEKFSGDSEVVCSSTISMQILIDADKSNEVTQLVYKFNLSHWSSWFVLIAAMATIGFSLISLSMTGNNFVDIVPFLVATSLSLAGIGIASYFSYLLALPQVLEVLPPDVLMKLAILIPSGYFVFYFGPILWAVCSGSKSEIRQLNAQFQSQGTLKVPDSVETVFSSLARGKGLIGGFDWSMAAQLATVLMVAGVLSYMFAPIYHLFGNRLLALFFEAGLIAFFYLMENLRRGSADGMITWWMGFLGLLDPLIIYVIVDIGIFTKDLNSAVFLSLAISALLFAGILIANVAYQAKGERQELMRDMLGDNMAFYSAMKLVGIFAYILSQLM